MSIKNNLHTIKKNIPKNVKLIAISKTKPMQDIIELYETGHKAFGENKVQELINKHEALPKDIEWHMIGHLQTNKVKQIAPFIHVIHSVDSIKLLHAINKEASKNNRVINCLFQVYIAKESTKYGLNKDELIEILSSKEFKSLSNIEIIGLMGMATFTNNTNIIKEEFGELTQIFNSIKDTYFKDIDTFKEISMGMSDDYAIAIKEGSTMVRIGSSIFGSRNYN